jgi:hypothetical protein
VLVLSDAGQASDNAAAEVKYSSMVGDTVPIILRAKRATDCQNNGTVRRRLEATVARRYSSIAKI